MLRRLGHIPELSDGGEDALARLERDRFDIVLMDGSMPGIDGFETTRRIRAREKAGARRTPIVAVTAITTEDYAERFRIVGADEIIFKPISAAVLEEAIAKALAADAANVLELPLGPQSSSAVAPLKATGSACPIEANSTVAYSAIEDTESRD